MCRIVRNRNMPLLVVMLASVLLVSLTACSPMIKPGKGNHCTSGCQWASIQFHNSIAQIFIERVRL